MIVYNEIDPFAAQWLRELCKQNLIAPGEVWEVDIRDIKPADLEGVVQFHAFAGIGVWSYALRRAGWPDDRPVWTGSCPCQPWSDAGAVHGRNKGEDDERDLWPDWQALISDRRPRVVFGEQVASAAALRWFDRLAADMERDGYTVGAVITEAAAFRQAQRRKRIYFSADADGAGVEGLVEARRTGVAGQGRWSGEADMRAVTCGPFASRAGRPEPLIRRMDDGTTARVEQLRGYGNAINAEQATAFIEAYLDGPAAGGVREG